MREPVDIAVVIVGLNARDYVRGCLRSLSKTDWGRYSHAVVYVDNASSDGSVEMVETEFPWVTVLANDRNQGFCRACNQGAAAVQSRYVYYLNDDTLVERDSIRLLAEFLDATPRAGVAGNRLLNPDGSEQWSARRFPSLINGLFGRRSLLSRWFPDSWPVRHYLYKDELRRSEPFPVDWVPGSCTMARREVIERVGGLPEDLHYWSDALLCDRIRRAGWEIFVVPEARLVHFEGKGSGHRSLAARCWHVREFHRSAFRFYCEHHQVSRYSPTRLFAGAALGLRAALLLAVQPLAVLWEGGR